MVLYKIEKYIEKNKFVGYDPYDGLNSFIFIYPLNRIKIFGIALIQLFKRLPFNIRPLLGIKKEMNPKALALLIKSYLLIDENKKCKQTFKKLMSLNSKKYKLSWGYNFPWYARAFIVKRNEPNLVTTVFCVDAILDMYEKTKEKKYLDIAIQSIPFFLDEMILFENEDAACFRYILKEKAIVHNANLLGAMILARLGFLLKEKKLLKISKKAINYSISKQNPDGSWYYGEMSHHRWIDNFHTGYNLFSIKKYQVYSKDKSFQKNLDMGCKYHFKNHFLADLTPKYYDNKIYPIDIHNFAQAIITFLEFGYLEKSKKLAFLAVSTMMNKKKGYFYFQKHRFYTNKIPYMRWSQAWMFYALSKLQNEINKIPRN